MVQQYLSPAFERARRIGAARLGMTLAEYDRQRHSGRKFCSACLAWHSLADFAADASKGDGLQSLCRAAKRRR